MFDNFVCVEHSPNSSSSDSMDSSERLLFSAAMAFRFAFSRVKYARAKSTNSSGWVEVCQKVFLHSRRPTAISIQNCHDKEKCHKNRWRNYLFAIFLDPIDTRANVIRLHLQPSLDSEEKKVTFLTATSLLDEELHREVQKHVLKRKRRRTQRKSLSTIKGARQILPLGRRPIQSIHQPAVPEECCRWV